jgi:hypothetical protein
MDLLQLLPTELIEIIFLYVDNYNYDAYLHLYDIRPKIYEDVYFWLKKINHINPEYYISQPFIKSNREEIPLVLGDILNFVDKNDVSEIISFYSWLSKTVFNPQDILTKSDYAIVSRFTDTKAIIKLTEKGRSRFNTIKKTLKILDSMMLELVIYATENSDACTWIHLIAHSENDKPGPVTYHDIELSTIRKESNIKDRMKDIKNYALII